MGDNILGKELMLFLRICALTDLLEQRGFNIECGEGRELMLLMEVMEFSGLR